MKEAQVTSNLDIELKDVPIPTPGDGQVVIKVAVSGSNPKDWKFPVMLKKSMNSGDDIAGTIYSLGSSVTEFTKGDRVAAFHEMRTPHGSFAEYALAWANTTFHISDNTSYEEAATVPLAAMTAAVGLYLRLGLPEPWVATGAGVKSDWDAKGKTPVLVYGAASAVGAFAIQLLGLSDVHPIIGIAGNGIPFAESLIDRSRGDAIIDYRKGDDALISGVREALSAVGISSGKFDHVFDAVGEKGSHENIAQVLAPGGKATFVLPVESSAKSKEPFAGIKDAKITMTMVGDVHGNHKDFGYVWFRYFGKTLGDGRFKGHPHTIIAGGLKGVSEGLNNLKDGKASATKYVFKVPDTEGAGKD